MANPAQDIKSLNEVFYKYNLVKGIYDYIIPDTEETPALFFHEWLRKDDSRIPEALHPDDHPRMRAYFDRLERKPPKQAHQASIVYRLRFEDGGFRWFSDQHVMIFNGDDHPHALIGSVRDITLEKEAESMLQTYAHLLSASSDYLALIDRQYAYQAISTAYAQQFEKRPDEIIGLSLTHDIIKSYRGALTVKSQPGKGSTFDVYIPVIEGPSFLESKAVESLPTGHEHILFVDDEDALADLGKQMIESLGYRVTSHANSLEALSLFERQPEAFDLVITDLVMPNMMGDELVRKIHQTRPGIPVILVTGFTDQMTPEWAAAVGAKRLAIKPIVMKDMARFIREALTL